MVFGEILKPLIAKAYDVTYVEYFRRGLEDLPEEAPAVFDWMDRKRRDPYPKKFEVVTARASDNRFYGVVVREFQPGRTTAPEAVEPFGKNLNPATIKMTSSSLSNLIRLETIGRQAARRLGQPQADRLRARRSRSGSTAGRSSRASAKPDLEPLLEDLRIRGDRQQVYWLKVPVG